jgi:uncharacterized membrane protein
MENSYKIYGVNNNSLFVSVYSNYFKLSDAKETYAKKNDDKVVDDTIILEVGEKENKEKLAIISIGVDEAEQFALALLNLCNSIKY